MAKKKQSISEPITYDKHGIYFSIDDIYGDLEDVTKSLIELNNSVLAKGYKSCSIDIQKYYDDVIVHLIGHREETDEEYKKRLADTRAFNRRLKEIAEAKKEAVENSEEFQKYLELKEKFGNIA